MAWIKKSKPLAAALLDRLRSGKSGAPFFSACFPAIQYCSFEIAMEKLLFYSIIVLAIAVMVDIHFSWKAQRKLLEKLNRHRRFTWLMFKYRRKRLAGVWPIVHEALDLAAMAGGEIKPDEEYKYVRLALGTEKKCEDHGSIQAKKRMLTR